MFLSTSIHFSAFLQLILVCLKRVGPFTLLYPNWKQFKQAHFSRPTLELLNIFISANYDYLFFSTKTHIFFHIMLQSSEK